MPAQVEAVDDVVQIALGLGLRGEVLLPLPLVEELLGEEVAVGVALRVEAGTGVAVPVPGAADAVAGLEQQRGEPGVEGPVELVDPGDAGTHDEHVDVRGATFGWALVGGVEGGVHEEAGPVVGWTEATTPGAPSALCTDRLVYFESKARAGDDSMAIVEQKWSALPVPYAIEVPDRVPKERYYDPDFYRLEAELLWPRVWQMACRLEEIPQPGDFAEYEILDQSVHRRAHRGHGRARLRQRVPPPRRALRPGHGAPSRAASSARSTAGATAPTDRTPGSPRPAAFSEHNLEPAELNLTPVRCETWGGCAWINLDADAPRCASASSPSPPCSTPGRWSRCGPSGGTPARLPVNWKLAVEAFVEQYHVLQSHPQLRIPGRLPGRDAEFDPRTFVDAELQYLRTMSDGMAGMVHARDVQIAEEMADLELPGGLRAGAGRRGTGRSTTRSSARTRARGCDMPDLNELAEQGSTTRCGTASRTSSCCRCTAAPPPTASGRSGPEETLMDMWSLTRYPPGEEPEAPPVPEPWDARRPAMAAHPDPGLLEPAEATARACTRGPSSTCGSRSERGAHLELPAGHRRLPGRAARPNKLLPALRKVNLNPLEQPVAEIEL